MSIQKREIGIAQQAKEALNRIVSNTQKNPDVKLVDLITSLKSLPTLFAQNGLLQAAALLKEKKNDVYNEFSNYLMNNDEDLLDYLTDMKNTSDYLWMQKNAIDFAIWLKQLGVAFHGEKSTV